MEARLHAASHLPLTPAFAREVYSQALQLFFVRKNSTVKIGDHDASLAQKLVCIYELTQAAVGVLAT